MKPQLKPAQQNFIPFLTLSVVKVRIAKVKPRKLIGKKAQASFDECNLNK